jgi:branched-chain amino acid transport system permease protein
LRDAPERSAAAPEAEVAISARSVLGAAVTGQAGRRVRPAIWGGAAAGLTLVALGFGVEGFLARFLADVFLWAALATAWNLLGGLAGYVSLGLHGFYGIGAFVTGIAVVTFAAAPWVGVLLSGGAAAALGAALGFPMLRARGHYYILASFAVAEALGLLVLNLRVLGIGYGGVLDIPPLDLPIEAFNRLFYFLMLGLLALSIATYALVARSRLGIGLRVIKEDEAVAPVLGIPTTLYKVVAFGISAGLAGLCGGVWALGNSHVEATQVFSVLVIVQVLVTVIVGGVGTVFGPTIGAALLLSLDQVVGGFQEWSPLIYGLAVLLVIRLAPRGLVELGARLVRGRGPGEPARPAGRAD